MRNATCPNNIAGLIQHELGRRGLQRRVRARLQTTSVDSYRNLSLPSCFLKIALIVCVCFVLSACDGLERRGSTLNSVLLALNFRVTAISDVTPAQLARFDVLFLWQIREALAEEEIGKIRDFVAGGGTLIVAGEDAELNSLFAAYGFELRAAQSELIDAERIPREPLFPARPVARIHARTDFFIAGTGSDEEVVPLYGRGTEYAVITFRRGNGRVFFMSCPYIFGASGLTFPENAAFLYNLMSTVPRKARIGLAEYRYNGTRAVHSSNPLIALLFETPGGLGILYLGVALFVFLMLRGRRFGKPLEARETHRRLSSEYVLAMTALYQKGNTRREVLRQLRDGFRADLGARWNVNLNLKTEAFVEEIAKRSSVINPGELHRLLMDLEPSGDISEAQLLEIAKKTEAYYDTSKMRRRNRWVR